MLNAEDERDKDWGVEVREEQMIVIIYQLTGQNNQKVKRPIKPQIHWTIR